MSREQIKLGNKMLGGCPYDEKIFPTTLEETSKFMQDKGFSDNNISAISGCLARLGWNNAVLKMMELECLPVEEVKPEVLSDTQIREAILPWNVKDTGFFYTFMDKLLKAQLNHILEQCNGHIYKVRGG